MNAIGITTSTVMNTSAGDKSSHGRRSIETLCSDTTIPLDGKTIAWTGRIGEIDNRNKLD